MENKIFLKVFKIKLKKKLIFARSQETKFIIL